jgi:hypothetical protein
MRHSLKTAADERRNALVYCCVESSTLSFALMKAKQRWPYCTVLATLGSEFFRLRQRSVLVTGGKGVTICLCFGGTLSGELVPVRLGMLTLHPENF